MTSTIVYEVRCDLNIKFGNTDCTNIQNQLIDFVGWNYDSEKLTIGFDPDMKINFEDLYNQLLKISIRISNFGHKLIGYCYFRFLDRIEYMELCKETNVLIHYVIPDQINEITETEMVRTQSMINLFLELGPKSRSAIHTNLELKPCVGFNLNSDSGLDTGSGYNTDTELRNVDEIESESNTDSDTQTNTDSDTQTNTDSDITDSEVQNISDITHLFNLSSPKIKSTSDSCAQTSTDTNPDIADINSDIADMELDSYTDIDIGFGMSIIITGILLVGIWAIQFFI